MFSDRKAAGEALARALLPSQKEQPVILALPRGGVVPGVEVARALKAPLSLVIPRKIGAPMNEEYAIGAITEDGSGVWNEQEKSLVDPAWLERAVEKEQAEAKRRREKYLAGRPFPDLTDRVVIIVDDGIATGLTVRAAIQWVKKRHPKKILVAVPVAPPDSVDAMKKEVDEVVVLETPHVFGAIGNFYEVFPQVSDEEVISLMKTV
jgi:predicted phosphoribosyltransferase